MFAVGDKVRVVSKRPGRTKSCDWQPDMDQYLGTVLTLTAQDGDGDWGVEENIYSFSPKWLRPVEPAIEDARELLKALETLRKYNVPEPDAPCIRFAKALVGQ